MTDDPDVILLRSADEPDPYLGAFAEVGLEAECVPVLQFTFPRQDALARHLERRDRYRGLIATSPRVGTALERAFAAHDAVAEQWRGAPAYAVGPKTAERLRSVGFEPSGQDAGTASALAEQIVERGAEKPLLFLCGNRRRDELPTRLEGAGVEYDELVVYRTEARTAIDLPSGEGRWLVFFSPSGLEAVERADAADADSFRIGAIGPTTAAAVEERGWSVEAVAQEPSPAGLVAALRRAEEASS